MIKVFLIFMLFQFNVLTARQIILVVGDDFNSSKAKLFCYDGSKYPFSGIEVNLGRNGLGWDLDDKHFIHQADEPIKHEGDGKSPAGIFELTKSFGYEDSSFLLPYIKNTANKICVDDVNSTFYNQIIDMPTIKPKSFEFMKRDDEQYAIGAVINYNPKGLKGRGSCIFLHVQKELSHPTSGCTSMSYNDLQIILKWLDPAQKPILVQIPKKYLNDVRKLFPQIRIE
ncbi:L,D-transpeptidase family protein [bacterium]|nr:L,D-transpeptidase family protein [bacterium]MBU1884417.1 L,D-transpeptidase family protein [bacterium]